jgi:patatin-related protein
MTTAQPGTEGPVKELRLGLVLYGGVSLAIYMHGTTKELHRLVRASADGDRTLSPTEQVYQKLLRAKAEADEGVRTRVVVDVIAGTSAGGINGVYLAKALAHDLPQDELRDLWFKRGDIGAILRGPRPVPWQVRLPLVLAMLWRFSALNGDRMAAWLYDALAGMDRRATASASLMPDGHRLQLFVTATDFRGYPREVVAEDPPVLYDLRHHHVLQFRYGDGDDDFAASPLHNAALAFAARTTSCFPGAFPAVSFDAFEKSLRKKAKVKVDLTPMEDSWLFRQYALSRAGARESHFVDGGVLDNRPFGHAIAAVQQRPADVEVDRRLLYLEPNPTDPQRDAKQRAPNPIFTVLSSASGIPRNEPILDEMLAIGAHNERVRQLRDIIETNWDAVSACVENALEGANLANPPADPDDRRLRSWGDRVHERALGEVGLGYATYLRAKIGDVVDTWADTVCRLSRYPRDCTQAAYVRVLLRRWAADAGLFQKDSAEPTKEQQAFLEDLDLGYRERRLRFLIAALNWWYGSDDGRESFAPARDQLDEGKAILYRAVADVRAARRGDGLPDDLAGQIAACFDQRALDEFVDLGPFGLERYLNERSKDLGELAGAFREHLRARFAGFGARVYKDLFTLTRAWPAEARKRLLIRHLGFPLWDALLFPLQSVAAAGERDHVNVVRMSPLDATLLHDPKQGPKLAGAGLHHFGAFFTRAGREQDYLWGRLDAAERLVTMLLGRDHPDRERWCHDLFDAIVKEEADHVPLAEDLVGRVRAREAPT